MSKTAQGYAKPTTTKAREFKSSFNKSGSRANGQRSASVPVRQPQQARHAKPGPVSKINTYHEGVIRQTRNDKVSRTAMQPA